MSTKYKSSPIFGWLTAGSDLLTAQLESVAQTVSDRLDDTHEIMLSMQDKGVQVENELKQALPKGSLFSSVQGFVSSMPLFSLLSGGKNNVQKEQQLTELSHKVDLLIEQVALLAAKEAAQKSAQASAKKAAAEKKPRAKPAAKAPADSKITATAPSKAAVEAKAETTKKTPAASSSKAKTTTTRKRRAPAKTTSVKSTSTKPASAATKSSATSSSSKDSTKTPQ